MRPLLLRHVVMLAALSSIVSVFLLLSPLSENDKYFLDSGSFPQLELEDRVSWSPRQSSATRDSPILVGIDQRHVQKVGKQHNELPFSLTGTHGDEELAVLNRDPSRIPGYMAGSNATYFGYVMRDFAARILSRHIVESGVDVLILSKDLPFDPQLALANNDLLDFDSLRRKFSIGQSLFRYTEQEGHRAHGLSVTSGRPSQLKDWWESFDATGSRPPWIDLAVVDPPYSTEDAVVHSRSFIKLLSECTVTYIVFKVSSRSPAPASFQLNGPRAVESLTSLGYKIQVLSSSHSIDAYPPNTLLDRNSTRQFLISGAHKVGNQGIFNAYLFATQGLDLAIPSQREYMPLGLTTEVKFSNGVSIDRHTKNFTEEVVLHVPFMPCFPSTVKIEFKSVVPQIRSGGGEQTLSKQLLSFDVFCGNKVINGPDQIDYLWMNGNTPEVSEAACVRLRKCGKSDRGNMACTTRIIVEATQEKSQGNKPIHSRARRDSNLLVLMIDPISRPMFDQMLPKTRDFLERTNFTSFDNYTVIGDNSGPNQAAMYAGRALSQRDDIASHRQESFSWIWDELGAAGYVTYKAEDGCIRNTNMVSSTKPNTTHGSAIQEMMCVDFNRPNCVGGKSAPEHLTGNAAQFVNEYSRRGKKWAAFASFIDSHEETSILSLTLDDPIESFLSNMRSSQARAFDDSLILVVSDHGFHYGSFLQTREGKQERARPVLFMKPPRQYHGLDHTNKMKWTTPYDVHKTLRDIMLTETLDESQRSRITSRGLSLLKPLPHSRTECSSSDDIPKRYCDLLKARNPNEELNQSEMVSPASMLSFFADIPICQKKAKEKCLTGTVFAEKELFTNRFPESCLCSTSHRNWYSCDEHPWSQESASTHPAYPQEYFAFVDCPDKTLHFETRFERDPDILNGLDLISHRNERPPNILFIEVDSVSIAHADRHFPKTREYLRKHRIRSGGSTYSCESGICAADFTRFSVSGPNSITNQVSALSGCLTTHSSDAGTCAVDTDGNICNVTEAREFGLQRLKTFNDVSVWCSPDAILDKPGVSPWMFDVAREEGYVTFFAEEFCCVGSPWVTQDNIFPLNAHMEGYQVHCRLAERYLRQTNQTIFPKKFWKGNAGGHLPCVDGHSGVDKSTISLDQIKSMWNAYPDKPKFAFLNSLVAHDYSARWDTVALGAESYDEKLLEFVTSIMSMKGAGDTMVVLRSDHGLQGGPMTNDYSTQIEHSRPWTQMLFSSTIEAISPKSLANLEKNQRRLASGFDLYTTLRSFMSTEELSPSLPPWSINLFTNEIPKSRSCGDAKLDLELCRNENEKVSSVLQFGTCNKYDSKQIYFCPNPSNERAAVLSLPKHKYAVPKQASPPKGIAIANKGVQVLNSTSLWKKAWKDIDNIVASSPKSKISGGIFLYPRQQSLLQTIVRRLADGVIKSFGRPLRICETGFGSGHSAAMFLDASPNVTVLSFDRFDRPYQIPAANKLKDIYGGRLQWVEGDSCLTVPKVLSPGTNPVKNVELEEENESSYQCDLLHGSSLCPHDNIDLVLNSPPGAILTSTAMNSLLDKDVYFGENAQWTMLRRSDCIKNITCFQEDELSLAKDFIFKKKNSIIKHSFCIAIVTGKCIGTFDEIKDRVEVSGEQQQPLHRLTASLNLGNMDQANQVEVPK